MYTELKPGSFETALNMENEYGLDRELQRTASFSGIRGIREQDLSVQEDQWGPISDRSQEHLGTTDLAIIALRRKMLRQLRELEDGVTPAETRNGPAYRVRSAAFVAEQDAVWYEADEARELMAAT